jgi:sugar O-acyltransferase (sialic acid O-acetyltransferase NeuD family)
MKKTDKVIVVGGEGTATNIADAICDAKLNYNLSIEFIGFANDQFGNLSDLKGYPVVCTIKDVNHFLIANAEIKIIYALYKPLFMRKRSILLHNLSLPFDRFINFIHPSCYLATSVKIGRGNVFLPNSVLHNNVSVNDFNIFNSNCVIEHDTVIGSSNFFAAGCTIGSSVEISNYNFFGLNSCIKEGLSIPEASFFGMGSTVINSPKEPNEIWYGNPARRAKINDN